MQEIDVYNITICSFKAIYSVLGEDMNEKENGEGRDGTSR